ncbi:MAG: histidine kinase [Candidatus Parabeggiatoa sp. nov. 3]|nr:MAG: histidine kinase [Gammaproteobacteria bacterium]RKZ67335.1 MAG: histidine kinase [Gammaproteobacteria bacterium]RKZ82263.1 MAG: histidine kinase [Gammaproteobacteria bacterium]
MTHISFFHSLRGKLLLLFLAVSLIPLITVGILTYTQARNALKDEVINKLIAVRDIKAHRIENYFKNGLNDVKMLSQNPFTKAAIRAFEEALHTDMKGLGQDEAAVMTQHYRPLYLSKPNLVNANDGSAYSAIHAQYHAMFKAYKEIYGYYDIFLVEPHAGSIIYSVVKEDDFGSSLLNGPYADTSLGLMFRKVQLANRDLTHFEDFADYPPSKEAASFVASPIFEEAKLIGVLIFQLPTEQIDAIMQERTGLGETGETILISSDDFLLRSNSHFFQETTLFKQKNYTEATRASATGETGVKMIIDYRGKPSIIAHTPLDIPDVKWSLNAKVDQAEAFAAAQTMRFWLLVFISLGIVFVVGAALFFSHSIAKPILNMTEIALRLAKGDMNLKVNVKNQDEIGVMAQAFQKMVVNLRLVIQDIVQVSQGLAQGDLRVMPKTEYQGEFVQIKNALETTLSDIRKVSQDIVQMAQELAEGGLHFTPKAEYQGDFIQIRKALEQAFYGRQQVIEDIVRVSQGLANGNLHVTPQAEYRGAFIQIQNAQKTALSNLLLVIEDIVQVADKLAEGRLDISPEAEYQGEFLRIKQALEMASTKLADAMNKNRQQDWLKTGQTQLNERMRGEQEPIALIQKLLNYLADYLNIQVGVFFLVEGERLKLVSSYAYKQRKHNDNEFKLGEGLVGQAALEKKSLLFSQVPEEHINLSINSGLGTSLPHDIFVLPLIYEQQVLGILELAVARHFTPLEIEFLEQIADHVAISLSSAQSRLRMQSLLEDSQKLTETLQEQQQEICDSEERMRNLIDTVIDGIITIDEQGIIESVNPAAEKMFDYMWSDLVGQNVKLLMPEPDRSQHDQYIHNYLTTNQAKIIGNVRELFGQRQNGSKFPIEISIAEVQRGEERLFTSIIRDITARKEAEAALQTQQEELRATNEELQSQSEELQVQQEELRQTNEELEDRSNELERQRDDIRQKNLLLEQHQIEREKAHGALEKKAKELELANQYKSEFLANMSHELRTPLNSMLILAHLLTENKEENLTEKQVEYVQTIHAAGSDLLTLINEILDLSKVEAGKIEICIEEIVLSELIVQITQKFKPLALKKELVFNITLADDLSPVLRTDAHRLQQIINNLLSNAFKFTEEGEIKFDIRYSDYKLSGTTGDKQKVGTLEAQAVLAFSVTDSGIGIPKDKQKLIFEAFQQVDGTTSRHYGGTGLGLSISRRLARLLKGELQLESESGQGSTFTLYLPDVQCQESEVRPHESGRVQASGLEADGDRPEASALFLSTDTQTPQTLASSQTDEVQTVIPATETTSQALIVEEIIDDRATIQAEDRSLLIIDDDRKFSRILMELAHEKQFKCIIAEDGKTSLNLAEQYKPNAIILDVGLPQLDGWSVMERLKDNPETRHIPVHFISASELSLEAKKMGAIGYLLKPVSMDDLGEAFKKIERFVANKLKNVLMLVDNERRRRKIQGLVGEDEVNLTIATTLVDASQSMHTCSFDCIIIDVDVEQGTGLQFLKLLEKEHLSQIPVILYAERDLTPEEEKILHSCEAIIPIKAVKSPERLLEEATLFLHQVEANLPVDKRKMLRMVHDKEAILKHKKVLIVDDDIRNTFALMTTLENKDMEVIVGETGQEALAQLEEHPDTAIVLMDIMMPKLDGYDTMRKIREQKRFRQLPIIALTAKAMKGDKAKCIDAGANDYLSKPVDTDKLLSLMRVWLYQ